MTQPFTHTMYERLQTFAKFDELGMLQLYSLTLEGISWGDLAEYKLVTIVRNQFEDFSSIKSHVVIFEREV